ncbi:MAG TPA: hypothetical protein VLD64_06860 [Nitrosarchaeum sp.]|nr:hypothetical protein [Nitrosarchaeum sp.]
MNNLGLGEIIDDLRRKICEIKSELNQLGNPIQDIPELITSTNLLRSNEYLTKVSEKQSELLSAYEQYSVALENMVNTIFSIQNDLKNLLKEQSKLISDEKPVKIQTVPKKRKSIAKNNSSKK